MACHSERVTVVHSGPPWADGPIIAVDPVRGYLVQTSPGYDGVPPQFYFRLSSETTVQGAGRNATAKDLIVGAPVAVWVASTTPGTNPPEIIAAAVIVYASP